MRRSWFDILTVSIALLFAAAPALAHHSFSAVYDNTKPVTFTGKVTKLEWMNPHIYFYVDVKDESGKTLSYAVEGGPPNTLYRQGWRKDSLKPGDTVTVAGFEAKDGSNHVNARNVTLPGGRRVFGGSADDGGPGPQRTRGR